MPGARVELTHAPGFPTQPLETSVERWIGGPSLGPDRRFPPVPRQHPRPSGQSREPDKRRPKRRCVTVWQVISAESAREQRVAAEKGRRNVMKEAYCTSRVPRRVHHDKWCAREFDDITVDQRDAHRCRRVYVPRHEPRPLRDREVVHIAGVRRDGCTRRLGNWSGFTHMVEVPVGQDDGRQ